MNLWVLCCIFGQCFSSSTFFPQRYPEPSSKIVFCLKVYHISDPCPTSVRYQISSDIIKCCPLTKSALSSVVSPNVWAACVLHISCTTQKNPCTNHFVFLFYLFANLYIVLAITLIINHEFVNSTMRPRKYPWNDIIDLKIKTKQKTLYLLNWFM